MACGDDLEDERKHIESNNDEDIPLNGLDESDNVPEMDQDGIGASVESDLESLVDDCAQEYTELDKTLDKLDECLDTLETRSDQLYSKVKDLLESSRQDRLMLQEQRLSTSSGDEKQDKH